MVDFVSREVSGVFHPLGTCRMDHADDPNTVVDPAARVIGVPGLRVVDASIMPTIPRGNTNIPTIILAEKLSDDILREHTSAVRAPLGVDVQVGRPNTDVTRESDSTTLTLPRGKADVKVISAARRGAAKETKWVG